MAKSWRNVLALIPFALTVGCTDGGSTSETVATAAVTTGVPATTAAADTTTAPAVGDTTLTTAEAVSDDNFSTHGADGPYDPARDARADIATAERIAAASGKLVLLDFGANWCPDCLVLDELYLDPAVAQLLDEHFVLVTIDVGEWDHNMDVSDDFNHVADVGIPALVVLAADGTILGDTADGSFASASTFAPDDVLAYLTTFV